MDKDKDGLILKKIGSHVWNQVDHFEQLIVAQVAEQWTAALKKHGFESHYEQWYGLIFSFPR